MEDPSSPLCTACKAITVHRLTTELDYNGWWWREMAFFDSERIRAAGMRHLENARHLPRSAESCALCALILKELLKCDTIENIKEEAILLSPRKTKQTFPNGTACSSWQLTGITVHVAYECWYYSDARYSIDLSLYAEHGSPAATCGDVAGRPPLVTSGCTKAHSLIRRWISACNRDHELCKVSLSGSVLEASTPRLPTRIIDTGASGSHEDPRLVETNGRQGEYVALSHCWGKMEFVKTTRENLCERLEAIPWKILPKTFQDAITITREVGLRYIWIDSLCIIQGDSEDWLRESVQMGYLFGRAYLVIAASDANNASEGCFFERKDLPEPIQISYVNSSGKREGSLFVIPRRPDVNESNGPLAKRAWITQEWILGRRIIFYTRECLIWSCRSVRSTEEGINYEPADGFRNFAPSSMDLNWQVIIEAHSSRNLTYFTDRLLALEGLRIEMQRNSNSEYHLGVFKKNLPEQLIWRVKGMANRQSNPLRLPTWSWASSMAPVAFHRISSPVFRTEKRIDVGDVKFEGEALIIPSGRLKELPLVEPNNLSDGYYWAHSNTSSVGNIDLEFDEAEIPQERPLYCLLLHIIVENWANNEDMHSYHFIVLQRFSSQNTYIRVGAGKNAITGKYLYSADVSESWFADAQVQSIRIV